MKQTDSNLSDAIFNISLLMNNSDSLFVLYSYQNVGFKKGMYDILPQAKGSSKKRKVTQV